MALAHPFTTTDADLTPAEREAREERRATTIGLAFLWAGPLAMLALVWLMLP